MAAAYLFYLCKNRPLIGENQRAALGACLVFLRLNGIEPKADGPEWEDLTLDVAAMQHRFAAEPIFAKTGKGFLISEGVAELERLKASSESDRRRLPVVSGQYAAD